MEEMLSDVCGELDIVKTGKSEQYFARALQFFPCHTVVTTDPENPMRGNLIQTGNNVYS